MSFPGDVVFLSNPDLYWPGGLCCVKRRVGEGEWEFGRVEAERLCVVRPWPAGRSITYPSVRAMVDDGWLVD